MCYEITIHSYFLFLKITTVCEWLYVGTSNLQQIVILINYGWIIELFLQLLVKQFGL